MGAFLGVISDIHRVRTHPEVNLVGLGGQLWPWGWREHLIHVYFWQEKVNTCCKKESFWDFITCTACRNGFRYKVKDYQNLKKILFCSMYSHFLAKNKHELGIHATPKATTGPPAQPHWPHRISADPMNVRNDPQEGPRPQAISCKKKWIRAKKRLSEILLPVLCRVGHSPKLKIMVTWGPNFCYR